MGRRRVIPAREGLARDVDDGVRKAERQHQHHGHHPAAIELADLDVVQPGEVGVAAEEVGFGVHEGEQGEEHNEREETHRAEKGVRHAVGQETGDAEPKDDTDGPRHEDDGADIDRQIEDLADVGGDEAAEDDDGGGEERQFDGDRVALIH